jgi:hypothetical protein
MIPLEILFPCAHADNSTGILQVSEELLWELFVQAGPVGKYQFVP